MKRTFQFLALVAICSAMMVSCKNTKTTEPTPEEIQAQKAALADSVLAEIDSLVNQLIDFSSKSFRLRKFELTDAEKRVKPDYLLEPSVANTLVSKPQKVRALAIYVTEQGLRKIYDMPCEEVDETITKLIAELNFPVDFEKVTSDIPVSQKIRNTYQACKERGDLSLFLQYEYAFTIEMNFIISQNPDIFYSRITEEQWQAFYERKHTRTKAIEWLANYDDEMAELVELKTNTKIFKSAEEKAKKHESMASEKEYYATHADKYAAKRNSLLQ